MRVLSKWALMLCKRLYKKPTFLVMLILIPICVFALSVFAKKGSGFVNIVIVCEDIDDEISQELTKKLISERSLISFTNENNTKKALSMVRKGIADAAWILPEGLSDMFENGDIGGIITVVEKETTVATRLAREKLSGFLYKYSATAKYINFTRQKLPQLNNMSDEQILEYYNCAGINEQLFEFADYGEDETAATSNYLLSPIRGILSLVIVLSSLAAALYFMQDEKNGTFSFVPLGKKPFVAFGSILIATFNIAAGVVLSIYLAGLGGSFVLEIASAFLFSICSSLFALALLLFVRNIRLYASLLPTLIITMLSVCPVFFDLRSLRYFQFLLPPTYYINALYNNMYFVYILIYIIVITAICFISQYSRRTKDR